MIEELVMNTEENKQKVALVLSGGGARGIAHIGVIEELERKTFGVSEKDQGILQSPPQE